MAKEIKNVLMEKLTEYKINIPPEAFEMMLLIVSESDRNPKIEDEFTKESSDVNEEKFYSSVKDGEELMRSLPEEFSKEFFYERVQEILVKTKKESEVTESENNIFYVKSEKVVIAVFISEEYNHCKDILWFTFEELSKSDAKCTKISDFCMCIETNEIDFLREMWLFKRRYADHVVKKYNLPDVELLTSLSSCLYEGAENKSILFIADDLLDECWEQVEAFGGDDKTRKLLPRNKRPIRKLMEIAGRGEVQLLATKTGRDLIVTHLVKCSKENLIRQNYVMFKGFLHWSIFVKGREMLSYYQGDYQINFDERDEVYRKIQTIKTSDTDMKEDMLCKLVKVLSKQKHGTSAILIKNKGVAKAESERLCGVGRGTILTWGTHYEKEWDEDTMLGLTSIDGALLMDWEGKCLAMGVIVDGIVKKSGKTERGARYNSIKNYIEVNAEKSRMIGIIVSEDGMVDVMYSEDKDEKI